MLLQIGGHTVSVEGGCAERFLSQYNGAKPFIVGDAEPEWKIRFGIDISDERATVLSDFVFSEINADCIFSCNGDAYYFKIYEKGAPEHLVSMMYRSGSDCVEATVCHNPSALRFAIWFAYSMLSAQVGTTFVHSSVIVYKERAILFLGESGTGKSTHTRLWLNNISGAHLLNDDSPVLSVEDGKPYVYGSMWSGKTPCYVARRFPLSAVVRLSQAPKNEIRSLSIPEAFAALQPSLPPALMQDERFADMLVGIISDTISVVPSFRLGCLPNADAARLSCKTVFGPL